MAALLSTGPAKEWLDQTTRLSSTWSGTDKMFMLAQYTANLVARLLPRLVDAKRPNRALWIRALSLLSGKLSDVRVWLRLFGLLPILQWYRDLYTMPTPKGDSFTETSATSRRLIAVEKLQAWSMLIYYPLEHYTLLASHQIIPNIKQATINKISLWSCRAWAAYVALQLVHISEERRLLMAKQLWIRRSGDSSAVARMSRQSIAKAQSLREDSIIQLSYLPLTLHWSLPNGLYRNEAWTGVFGSIAAWYQLRRLFQ